MLRFVNRKKKHHMQTIIPYNYSEKQREHTGQ